MIWLVILVAFPSVPAFVRNDLTPRLHAVTEGSDKQETGGRPQGSGGGRERSWGAVSWWGFAELGPVANRKMDRFLLHINVYLHISASITVSTQKRGVNTAHAPARRI